MTTTTMRRGISVRLGVPVAIAGLGIALAACGSPSAKSTSTTLQSSNQTNPAGRRPGVSGLIAAVSNGSMQVQNPTTGETTVNFGASTTFRRITTVTSAAVASGECITATGTPTASPTTTTTTAGSPGGRFFDQPVTATRILISQPTNGQCGLRPGGAPSNGQPPRLRRNGTRPNGTRPQGVPSFAVDTGTVSAVSGNTITVAAVDPVNSTTTQVTVTTTGSTVYEQEASASSSAAVVGQCASAFGSADSTGAVTATSVTVSPPVNGSCTTGGFGGGFGGRFGGGGGAGGGGTAGAATA